LRRDGYVGDNSESCIIVIDAQCRGVAYDPYDWGDARTKRTAHAFIAENWDRLRDGEVVDVQYILRETTAPKQSERVTAPI
jgi:hypothetical protein